MDWIKDDVLSITNEMPNYPDTDRSVELEIGKEIYHENGLACTSLLMKDEYEQCYINR